MSKSAKKHPPKKKHPKRPRPEPIVPLTDEEREHYAKSEFAKASMHLEEAEAQTKARIAPNAAPTQPTTQCTIALLHPSSLQAGSANVRISLPATRT